MGGASYEEARLQFELYDANNDGRLDKPEFMAILEALGLKWEESQVDKVMKEFSKDEDGTLSCTSFWNWANQGTVNAESSGSMVRRGTFIKRKLAAGFPYEVACRLFDEADKNNDGFIDAEDQSAQEADLASAADVKNLLRKSSSFNAGTAEVGALSEKTFQEVVQTFEAWDANGDGTLEINEMTDIMHQLNPSFTSVEMQVMVSEIDGNADGFVDIFEFIAWVSGQSMKDAQREAADIELEEARLGMALHKARAAEARELGLQEAFEKLMHGNIKSWCKTRKIKASDICGTLNEGLAIVCSSCDQSRHAWLCHYCGFVSFGDTCTNNCASSSSSHGWSCISGKCLKRKCGCKRSDEFWQRCGFIGDVNALTQNAATMLGKASR
mmetsp:Transcript_44651/g.80297  ORF Transcript_44651/g.80297 Transcript_44651/m.80297 type:complete len:384 (-) Transcript_44651:65-1216(-)